MTESKTVNRQNIALLVIIHIFYFVQVVINIAIEGFASVFPPVILFMLLSIILLLMIKIKIKPKITMFAIISCVYIYFFYLINDSPFLINYLFMWLGLPLSTIYLNYLVISISGLASILLTIYTYYFHYNTVFGQFFKQDFIYLILIGAFLISLLLIFIYKIKVSNEKMRRLAYYDALTDVGNRFLLKEKFNMFRNSNVDSIGLVFIDMNGFKKINDTYGHEIGDQLLKTIALRLNSVVRDADCLCRLGGDEFVILCCNIDNRILENMKKRIHSVFENPFRLNQHLIVTSASVGSYSTTDVLHADLETMVDMADRAMYKEKGEGLVSSFVP